MEQNDVDVLLSIKKSIELLNSCIMGIYCQQKNIENVKCCAKIEGIVNTYSEYFNDVYVMQMTNSIDSLIKNINSTLTSKVIPLPIVSDLSSDWVSAYSMSSPNIRYGLNLSCKIVSIVFS